MCSGRCGEGQAEAGSGPAPPGGRRESRCKGLVRELNEKRSGGQLSRASTTATGSPCQGGGAGIQGQDGKCLNGAQHTVTSCIKVTG